MVPAAVQRGWHHDVLDRKEVYKTEKGVGIASHP
jgi:hypothetical protein